ncbi:hypothetical protein BH09BAC1_BH09BAC1_11460 [soil metagenome]
MKKTHIVVLVFIAACVGVIIARTGDYSTYETFTTAADKPGQEFHVVGQLVKDKERYYKPEIDPNYFSFYMVDNEGVERKVVFPGTEPPDFDKSEQIVIVGKVTGDEFRATQILTKCPSKYIEDELEVKEYNASTT